MNVIIALDGFKSHKLYYSDTDGVYIHKNDFEVLKEQNLIGKDLYQSKNAYGDAGIVYASFMSAKLKYCIVIGDNGLLQQKITFKVCDREKSQIGFKVFLNMEKAIIVRNTSKLNWKRVLLGARVPQTVIKCENCQNHKMCRSCIIDPNLNCFDCEISRSCDKCLKRITQVKVYSTEINKLRRLPPDEYGYMLPHFVGENIVEVEGDKDQTQVSYGKCSKCFVELNLDNHNKKKNLQKMF